MVREGPGPDCALAHTSTGRGLKVRKRTDRARAPADGASFAIQRFAMMATKTAPKPKASAAEKDAIALLKADHAKVSALFADYDNTRSLPKKKALVAAICTELNVHAQIEVEIFYPDVKTALKDKVLVPEATDEHAGVKDASSRPAASAFCMRSRKSATASPGAVRWMRRIPGLRLARVTSISTVNLRPAP